MNSRWQGLGYSKSINIQHVVCLNCTKLTKYVRYVQTDIYALQLDILFGYLHFVIRLCDPGDMHPSLPNPYVCITFS